MHRSLVLLVLVSSPAFATDPSPKILPNGSGDGYATYATDAYGAFTSSECGGGLNTDGSTKPLGAAEFDPYNPALTVARGRGGVTCNTRIYLFSPDNVTPRVRQIFAVGPNGWSGQGPNNLHPDGTPLTVGIRPADLISDDWIGPGDRVRRTQFFPHLFPGLQVDLDQRASCAALTQVYRFTNTGTTTLTFRIAQVSDTDLSFGSNFTQNWGRRDASDPNASLVYNNAKDVALLMRARMDFDTTFEGWRIKLQGSAGWDHLRVAMYYGFPSDLHQTPRCQDTPLAAGCPAPTHLNGIFRASNGANPSSYGISPDFSVGLELNNDLTGPGSVPDGWSDSVWDVAQSLQSLYIIPPGESREYRTLYEGIPSYCRVQTDAGYDTVVAVAEASSCAETVTLDASRSVVSGGGAGTSTYTWFDVHGQQVASGATATVDVVGSGEHRFDLRVCNADNVCDIDFVVVIATDEDGECADTDGDGVIDTVDLDDDDDGIADVAEGTTDTDGDGFIDSLDLDSDDDNVPDMLEGDDDDGVGVTAREQLVDADHDGRVDFLTRVDDGDGWDDRFQDAPPSLPDFDGDGVRDVIDDDDDDDEIPTALECPDGRTCPNNAGQPDYLDVQRFACSALYSASASTWLGAGGTTNGHWTTDGLSYGAIARDGWHGHLYIITSTGALWRATPGAEALIGETGLVGVTALTATPEPGALLAGVPGATTTDLFRVSTADASVVSDSVLPGVIGDITFDRVGNRVYTRMSGSTAQVVGATTVTTAAFVQGLSMRPDGTLVGLTVSGTTLTVSTINPTTGALTAVFEPTRVWRPALTPAAPYDLGQCPPNLAPALVPDIVVTPFGVPADVAPLTNDGDRDGTLVVGSFAVGAPDVDADVTTTGPGQLTVAPASGHVGAIAIDYSVADDDGYTASSEVIVLVAPDAQDDVFYRLEGAAAIDFTLAANDHGAGTYTLHDDAPSWVTIAGATLVTTPGVNVGTFEFGYDLCYTTPYVGYETICDAATVTLVVNARPSLDATTSTTHVEGDPVELDVASIYGDPEGHPLDVGSVAFSAPPGCTLGLSQDGTRITATPSSIETCVITISACDTSVTPGCTTTTWTVVVTEPPCGGIPSDELVELCDGTDDNCDGSIDEYFDTDCGPGQVYYAIVEDDAGPVGTIRCWVNGTALDCDREPTAPDELLVYPALLCPAYATHGGTP